MSSSSADLMGGRLWPRILLFSLPLVATNILQFLYNTADSVVVSRWGSETALAAVGATGALSNLFVNLFVGLSVGVSVEVAQSIGARDEERCSHAVHTSILLSICCGVFLAVMGFFLARPMLLLMGTPQDVIDLSSLYMRIIFLGMPVSMLYNFGGAILRARGDTRRPLIILAAAGMVNVLLNLLFVIVFHMNVAGVALATVISQAISACLVLLVLSREEEGLRFSLSRLAFHGKTLASIVRIGLPAGLQSCLFSASNVLIQSSVNSFGSAAMKGNTAAASIADLVYISTNAVANAAVTFTGQFYGAKSYRRIGTIAWECMVTVLLLGGALGLLVWGFSEPLLGIYKVTGTAMEVGKVRIAVMAPTYFTCGFMETMSSMQRGMGSSFKPMVISLIGSCVLRIVWIYTVFRMEHTLFCLYLSYPISWVLTTAVHIVFFLALWRKTMRAGEKECPDV